MFVRLQRLVAALPAGGRRLLTGPTFRVMAITMAGMLLSLLVDVLIAARLGATAATDELIVALTIPRVIETIGREGTRFSLLSLFVEVNASRVNQQVNRYYSGLVNLFLVAGALLSVLGLAAAPYLIQLTGPGLDIVSKQVAARLFRLAMPLVMLAAGTTVLEAILNSKQRFVVASLRNGVVLGTVLLLTLVGWQQENVAEWIAVGYSAGYLLYFLGTLWYCVSWTDFTYHWFSWPDRQTLQEIHRPILYPTVGMSIRQIGRVVERAIASTVAPGSVAIYYFAFRLISAAQSIIGISVTTTGLPNISRLIIRQEYSRLRRALKRQLGRIAFVTVPTFFFILLFGEQLVNLLYHRGSVSEASLQQILVVLQFLAAGLLFWAATPVLSSALFAFHKHEWVLYKNILMVIFNLWLAWYFASSIGLIGIALAAIITMALGTVGMYILLGLFWRKSTELPG